MKKIIATALCLTMATPCFAAGRHHNSRYYVGRQNRPPHIEYGYEYRNYPPAVRPCSQRTRTLAVVAGVGVAAAIISAIAD